MIHDGFRGSQIPSVFAGKMSSPEFQNVVLDVHRYQCFGDEKKFDHAENIHHVGSIAHELREIESKVLWTICGEWSIATGGWRSDVERQDFYDAQVKAFSNCHGSFFGIIRLKVEIRIGRCEMQWKAVCRLTSQACKAKCGAKMLKRKTLP